MDGETAISILEDEIGQLSLPNSSQMLVRYWDVYADVSNIPLRMEYVRLCFYRVLMARYQKLVDTTIGKDNFQYSQLLRNASMLYDSTQKRIAATDPSYGGSITKSFTCVPRMPDRIEEIIDDWLGL